MPVTQPLAVTYDATTSTSTSIRALCQMETNATQSQAQEKEKFRFLCLCLCMRRGNFHDGISFLSLVLALLVKTLTLRFVSIEDSSMLVLQSWEQKRRARQQRLKDKLKP